jgi:hypothetical protein
MKVKCPRCGKDTLRKNGGGRGKQRWICTFGKGRASSTGTGDHNPPICYSTVDPKAPYRGPDGRAKEVKPEAVYKRALGSVRRYVVTSAQNATPVHKGFLAALDQYCRKNKAELLVIPFRYKNPTSRWTESQANADFWELPEDLLFNIRHEVNENLAILGDIKTQPTAVNPLTGFESISGGKSAILGHAKLQLKTVPTPQGRLPKILTTTGACTLPNYVNSRTGKVGEFHHMLGATVVEVQGKVFHMRQLLADKDGSFYDLNHGYSSTGAWVSSGDRPLSLTMGDTHVDDIDPDVEAATFNEIIPDLKPTSLVYHDLVSGVSVNHHTERNPFVSIARARQAQSNVSGEFMRAFDFVTKRLAHVSNAYIVPSNHNDWLHWWILNSDWRTMNPFNRRFYLEVALAMAIKSEGLKINQAERLNAFIELAKTHFSKDERVKVLDYDESCMLGEIEHGMHGHLGPNGARGNIHNLRRIGVKSNTGHVHTPGIDEGAWSAGTSTRLRLGYNRGPSGWLNAHILTYANSKRTFLNIINGKWRLE